MYILLYYNSVRFVFYDLMKNLSRIRIYSKPSL